LIYFDEEKKNTPALVAGIYVDAMREFEIERKIEQEIKEEATSEKRKKTAINFNFSI
jgi:hypothetical protein